MAQSKASLILFVLMVTATLGAACTDKKSPTAPSPPPPPANLTPPSADSPSDDEQLDTLRPTLVVKNGTSDQPAGTRTYEFQISDSSEFPAAASLAGGGFAVAVSATGIGENGAGKTSFQPDQDLQPTTRFYWRARVVQGTARSEWSPTTRFRTRLVGYNRPGEVYDPLIHGETVGERIGPTSFVPGKGIRLESHESFVRYLLPQTITSGEFSMEVEGLRGNTSGDKSKVFGMQEGTDDYITNRYRVDVQYRGTGGSPPNAITFRALYGSASDLNVRYEPDTATRFASVFMLSASVPYYWKATWGSEFRVTVKEGGVDGTRTLYNVGVRSTNGTYAPSPHYAFVGTPTGRSGAESATIPGTIYRNVWISSRARPQSLGSALRAP